MTVSQLPYSTIKNTLPPFPHGAYQCHVRCFNIKAVKKEHLSCYSNREGRMINGENVDLR